MITWLFSSTIHTGFSNKTVWRKRTWKQQRRSNSRRNIWSSWSTCSCGYLLQVSPETQVIKCSVFKPFYLRWTTSCRMSLITLALREDRKSWAFMHSDWDTNIRIPYLCKIILSFISAGKEFFLIITIEFLMLSFIRHKKFLVLAFVEK